MSALEKIRMSTMNVSITKVVVVAVLIAGIFCILPLYLQNRVNSLYDESHKLSEKVVNLQRDAMLMELQINQLSSLENLTEFAEQAELGLNGLPVKVMKMGGANE